MDMLRPITTRNGPGLLRSVTTLQTIDGVPYKLWNIYEDDGVIKLATCEQVDVLPTNWKVIDIIDIDAKEVSICFDGTYVWNHESETWKLHTDGMPWIFWVNSFGVLKAQKYGTSGHTDLSYNVESLTSVRAWKNPLFPDRDQGLVVAYIQLGAVRYRNYAYQSPGVFAWENERELDYLGDARVARVTAFSLNDYRIGFALEDTSGNMHWAITHRNWVGMASPNEYLSASVPLEDITFEVTDLGQHVVKDEEYLTAGLTDVWFNAATEIFPAPIFAWNPNDSEFKIALKFNYELHNDLAIIKDVFTIRDSQDKYFEILSTEAGFDNAEIIFNMAMFAGAVGTMFIKYTGGAHILSVLYEGSFFDVDNFDFEFAPKLVIPEGNAFEHLAVTITPEFVVTDLNFKGTNMEQGNITFKFTDVTFEVTKIGTNPL